MKSIRYARGARSRRSEINMTPLIDMVFILLIFFMVSSTFLEQPGMKLDLPAARAAEALETKYQVKVLERNAARARMLSQQLNKCIVLLGDSADEEDPPGPLTERPCPGGGIRQQHSQHQHQEFDHQIDAPRAFERDVLQKRFHRAAS